MAPPTPVNAWTLSTQPNKKVLSLGPCANNHAPPNHLRLLFLEYDMLDCYRALLMVSMIR